jgi:hypothetical protein
MASPMTYGRGRARQQIHCWDVYRHELNKHHFTMDAVVILSQLKMLLFHCLSCHDSAFNVESSSKSTKRQYLRRLYLMYWLTYGYINQTCFKSIGGN